MRMTRPAAVFFVVLTSLAPLVAGLAGGTLLWADRPIDRKLPEIENLEGYGCTLEGPIQAQNHHDPSPKQYEVWRVQLWAEHRNPQTDEIERDWRLIYSYRQKRSDGLEDCERFFQRVIDAKDRLQTEVADAAAPSSAGEPDN